MKILRRNLIVTFRICVLCLVMCLIMVLVMTLFPLEESNQCHNMQNLIIANPPKLPNQHFLCILIPFRDRFDELNEFVPTISKFLNGQNLPHAIFVINQVDSLRFNRASLINVGFLKSQEVLSDYNCDYIAIHDVDLVPINPDLSYAFPDKGPFHVAAPGLHPKYDYPSFLGGILLITRQHYQLVNGKFP